MALSDSREINQVVFEGRTCVKKMILKRPGKLNTLTYEMISQMTKKLKDYENDSEVKLLILKGKGRAFCAGGDVLAYHKFMTAGHWSFGASYYKKILILDYLLATYKKPLVALMDGIVMGAGVGMSIHFMFKIVTENTLFAMPEVTIGTYIGNGASYFLSRLPGYIGEYLGLTGAAFDGREMIACGLATHFVLSKDLHLLEKELEEVSSSNTTTISHIINKFVHKPNVKQLVTHNRLKTINRCFSEEKIEDILLALEKQVETREEKWLVDAINSMKSSSPTSLKISLRSIKEGRRQNLQECFVRDYTISCHVMRRTGVRAKLLGKDEKPKWEPSKLELVTEEMVGQYFNKLFDEEDWEFLQLPPRPNLVDINVASKL